MVRWHYTHHSSASHAQCLWVPLWTCMKGNSKIIHKGNLFPFFPPLYSSSEARRKKEENAITEVFSLYSCRSSFLLYPGLCLSPYLDLRYDLLGDKVGKVPGCCFALSPDFLASLFFIWGLSPLSPWQGWICLLVSTGLLSTLLLLETAELLSTVTFRLSCFHLWHVVESPVYLKVL